jgi:hypothetical protein
MANSISGIVSVQPVHQPQQVASPKPEPKVAAQQPKADVVTISGPGKQAVQLRTAGSTPAEELQESPIAKAVEAQAGKK